MAFFVALALGVVGALFALVGGFFVLRSFGRRSGGASRTGLGAALIMLGAAALIAAPFTYAALNDAPDELDADDLTAALATAPANSSTTTAAASTVPGLPATTVTPATTDASGTSTWTATGASIVGYRIDEVLFGVDTVAVGRSNAVTGSISFDGATVTAAEFEVAMATLESDDGRRDGQYRQIMSVDEFPTATFTLTQPIEVGSEPVEGATATATATGELTLRGTTLPVTFELTAEVANGKVGVLGSIPIVFADYGIANPSRSGITTEDNGLLEFVLVFDPA